MAGSVRQSKKGYFSGNSTTVSFNTAVQGGNTIVISLHMYEVNEATTVISDTTSNSYVSQFFVAGGDGSLALNQYFAVNISATDPTITINPGGTSTYCSYTIVELAGVATSNIVDVQDTNSGTGTAVTAGPITPTVSGDVLIGSMTSMAGGVVTITPDADYTEARGPARAQ